MPPRKSPPHPVGRRLADFGDLLPAEIALRDACREGRFARISATRPEAKTEANHIRPGVLRVFCLGLDPEAPVHEKGVLLRGAWIEDDDGSDLDLAGCHLPAPLWLRNCHLVGRVVAMDATARQLGFGGTRCAGIAADRLTCAGGVFLRNGFRAEGPVRLLGAGIGGDLACIGGRFEGDPSLDLTKSKIGGTGFFRNGFHAAGSVDLQAAEIDVLIDEEAAWTGATLRLDGLTIRRFAGDAPVDAAARIRWLDRQPAEDRDVDFKPQPWEECARVLAGMGHERDARMLRIEKRRRMRPLPWIRAKTVSARGWAVVTFALDLIVDVTTGYGWRPLNALVGLVILWIAAVVGYSLLPAGVMAPTDALVYLSSTIPPECRSDWLSLDPRNTPLSDSRQIAAAEALGLPRREWRGLQIVPEWKEICTRAMPSEYSTFSPFAYAADVLLPIVDLRQEHDWSPRVTDANGEVIAPLWTGASWGWGYLARLAEWALILAGWGLSALLLGAVTGVIRRD